MEAPNENESKEEEKEENDIYEILDYPKNKNQGIKTITEGKRFESYIGWLFAKSFEVEKYNLGSKYSFLKEAERAYEIIDKYYKNSEKKKIEKNKIKQKVEEFIKKGKYLITEDSKSSQSKTLSVDSNKDEKTKKEKKKDDISGDFDIIIPNVNKIAFQKILENNFYSNKDYKCIIFDEDKIKGLPEYFHIFIEVGLNSFQATYKHKSKQIQKYISILNFGKNIIDNENIRKIYEKDFQIRYSLNLNSSNKKISDTSIFMLVFNSDYGEFTSRFLDNRKRNKSELNSLVPKKSKEILLCCFVDFGKTINSFSFKIFELSKKIKKNDRNNYYIAIFMAFIMSIIINFLINYYYFNLKKK